MVLGSWFLVQRSTKNDESVTSSVAVEQIVDEAADLGSGVRGQVVEFIELQLGDVGLIPSDVKLALHLGGRALGVTE